GENRIAPRRLPEAIAPLGRSPHWRTAWTDSSRGRARQQGVACNAAFQVIRYIYVETAANSDMDAIQTCPHNPLAEGLTAQRGQFSCGWAARKSPASIPPRRCNSIQDGAVGDVLLQAHVRRATHHHGACRRTVLHHCRASPRAAGAPPAVRDLAWILLDWACLSATMRGMP